MGTKLKTLRRWAEQDARAPPCIDCGEQTQPPYKRCQVCELKAHYEKTPRAT